MHDVGQEAQAREGAQRGGKRERAAAVQQSPPTPILPTGAVRPERPGTRNARAPRRILPHGKYTMAFSPRQPPGGSLVAPNIRQAGLLESRHREDQITVDNAMILRKSRVSV